MRPYFERDRSHAFRNLKIKKDGIWNDFDVKRQRHYQSNIGQIKR